MSTGRSRSDRDLSAQVWSRLSVLEQPHVDSDVPESPPVDDLAGRTFGPYQIETLIGSGGMGEVYRARDTRLNRPVAIKFLSPDLTDQPARLRFQKEAKMAPEQAAPIGARNDVFSFGVVLYEMGSPRGGPSSMK